MTHLVLSVPQILAPPMGVQWYLIVAICSSPTVLCLFPVCVSSLVRPLKVLAHFLIERFVFMLSSFKSSLFTVDNRALLDVSFAGQKFFTLLSPAS